MAVASANVNIKATSLSYEAVLKNMESESLRLCLLTIAIDALFQF